MSLTLHLEAETRRIRMYNLNEVEHEGIDVDQYDLESFDEIDRFIEQVDALVESGELDLIQEPLAIDAINPDAIDEAVLGDDAGNEERIDFDDVVLENLPIDRCRAMIESAQVGDILYLRSEIGGGFWDLLVQCEEPEGPLKIGYFDCSAQIDTYDALRESYYDLLCDSMLPSLLRCGEIPFRLDAFDFKPRRIGGQLYRIAYDPLSGRNIPERLPYPGKIFVDETLEI